MLFDNCRKFATFHDYKYNITSYSHESHQLGSELQELNHCQLSQNLSDLSNKIFSVIKRLILFAFLSEFYFPSEKQKTTQSFNSNSEIIILAITCNLKVLLTIFHCSINYPIQKIFKKNFIATISYNFRCIYFKLLLGV